MKTLKYAVALGALGLLFAAGAFADTLELKDGRVIEGKYLGGTQVVVRFEVQGDVQVYRLNEISSISFERRHRRDRDRDRDGDAGGPPPNAPNDAPPPPNDQGAPPPNPPNNSPDNGPNIGPPPQDQSQDTRPPVQSRDTLDVDNRDRGRDEDRNRDRDARRQSNYAQPGSSITVPAGQNLLVRMIDEVDSRHNDVGDVFKASLETDLVVNDTLVAPRGSDVFGRLAYAKEGGHFAGSSELQLELTRIIIDGKEFPIVSGEYTLRGKGRGEDTAKKVGGGAAVGAIIGAIAGGGQGAAIGAGVGGAAGATAQAVTKGKQVKVPSETLLEFRLEQPVTVTPTQR